MDNQSNYAESSICSNTSEITVSAFGEEMELTEAVDTIFNQIQDHINELHVQVRQLSMCEDRNESYEEAYAYYYEVGAHVKEGGNVFKELTKVMKQLLPNRPKDLQKNWEKTGTWLKRRCASKYPRSACDCKAGPSASTQQSCSSSSSYAA